MHSDRGGGKSEKIDCNRRPHPAGNPRFRRPAIRDLGVPQKSWPVGSNRGRKAHRTRPQAGNRDGRALDHNVYASFRSRMASYGSPIAAENIAMGTRTFGDTFAVWKSSSGHNANLLLRNATRIGLASASDHGTTYWALILAAPAEPKQRSVDVLSIFPFVILMRGGAQ